MTPEQDLEDEVQGEEHNSNSHHSVLHNNISNEEEGDVSDAHLIRNLDADKLLTHFGNWNWRSILYLLAINLCWVLYAIQTLIFAFIADPPPFDCAQKINQTKSVFDPSEIDDRNFTNQCTVDNSTVKCVDDTDYEFVYSGQHGYTMVEEWDLVCDEHHLSQLPNAIYQIGSLLSMVVLTQLSDIYGRHLIFVIGFSLSGVAGVVAALSPTLYTFAFMRLVIGLFSPVLTAVSWVYCCEMLSPRMRLMMSLYFAVFWNIGYCMMGLMAMYIPDWRSLYWLSSAPFIATAAYYWLLPESPHWLLTNSKVEKVRDWIKASEEHSGPLKLQDAQREETMQSTHSTRTLWHALRSPVLVYYLIVFSYLSTSSSLMFWALSLFSTQLSKDRYIGYFLTGLIEIPAGLAAPALLSCFGRRSISAITYLLIGIIMFALVYVPSKESPNGDEWSWLRIGLSLAAKFGVMIVYSSIYLLIPETLPTTTRNVCFGVIECVGKIGSIAAPYLGILAAYDARMPPAIMSMLAVISAVLCCTVPETNEKVLPEDIPDVDPGPLLGLVFAKYKRHKVNRHTHSNTNSHQEEMNALKA